ncbi:MULTISPECIES: DUF934 domain-containing protein [Comamonas]|jgi:uncharacterized protein (DUF934 family)|uniref:DUF934 domain-containing protein n=1 Tax=Comamonas terrigena TaxID=32013 RepID=A0A2A7UUJ2_COMTR|nr:MULTISPECIES: DUF934 domain-containing protein [Comamonas]MBD9530217.1 DUF934 domain-containing protein [Comamonas sp. CMM01]MDH0048829.1 DUF934 domain-containing protein [Comamonas terrigena]MDH0511754.1 DUF934 domain-containing protein [Comamonas terrigena]MDH1091085.1 DUF934 domain-containing protein [Comamonas terrigena]MDH1292168.1 DUF934 domain-containing protein [Comamonas terrigena]
MQILTHSAYAGPAEGDTSVLVLANDANALEANLDGITQVDLHFPNFTDGRAFSQAYLLRRRRGFSGDIRATGDVLIDQLVQMERTGFSSAVLRADVDAADAQRQFERFGGYYQADAVHTKPHFAEEQA